MDAPYATATKQNTAFHDSVCDGASKRDSKVGIVIVPVVSQIAEVHNLVASRAEQDVDLLLQFVSAMIGAMPIFIFPPQILVPCGLGMDLLQVALGGPNGNHGIFVSYQNFRAARCVPRCPH